MKLIEVENKSLLKNDNEFCIIGEEIHTKHGIFLTFLGFKAKLILIEIDLERKEKTNIKKWST